MSTETRQVNRTIRWLQGYAGLMTIAIVVLFIRSATATDGVLRVRGLIIEDEAGRERILIGAPIPEAANRVRTDEARVRELWGPRFPDLEQYMGWYRDYQALDQRNPDSQRGRLRPAGTRRPGARSEHRQAHRAEHRPAGQ